jgi:hypothetical protein
VAAQRVSGWKPWMLEIEILGGVVGHAEPFHNAPRAPVRRHCEGNDLSEAEPSKPVIDRSTRGLSSIAPSPIGPRQAPSNLDRRRERQGKAQIAEADDADNGASPGSSTTQGPKPCWSQ